SDELGITETEYVTLYGFPLAVIEATGGVSPTPTEQVLDNDGLDAAATGDWTADTEGTGYEGSDYATRFGGTGTYTFTWTPTIGSAQEYQVYAKWPQGLGDSGRATYTVHHAGGSDEVTVSQAKDGGEWNLLGVYPMTPAANHRITLSDKADTATASEIIIDNTDPNAKAIGSWVSDTDINQYNNINVMAYHGTNYVRHAAGGTGENTFRWSLDPLLKTEGRYKVYARWAKMTNRSTDVDYTVYHNGGSTTGTVNQQENGGMWNLLGAYDFSIDDNQKIEVADKGDGTYVIADSVRLVRDLDGQDGDDIIVDNTDATLTGASWITGAAAGQLAVGADYLYRPRVGSGANIHKIAWEPTLSRSGRY
ncbi:hypothetical protein, partial [Marinobacter alexandrii]|uniref:golvesin C-terminal-like domain-containing protein n=1 Tax=Marinobacter alexandrii TaxID=2570351 RepID=UPI0032999C8F